jgi:hypothetical protein
MKILDIPEYLRRVLKGFLQVDIYEEIPQIEQYGQFSSEIRRCQHQKDNMQHSLEQILSFYPYQVKHESVHHADGVKVKKTQEC